MTIKDLMIDIAKLMTLLKEGQACSRQATDLKSTIAYRYARIPKEEKEKMKDKMIFKLASHIASSHSFAFRRFSRPIS
jgi:hypothetical protein